MEELQFSFKTNRDEFRRAVPYNIGGVYFLYDKDMALLYIGQTVNFRDRFESHLYGSPLPNEQNRKLFNTFYYIRFIVVAEPEKAIELESEYIFKYKPLCNVRGKGSTLPAVRQKYGSRGGNKISKQIKIRASLYDGIMEYLDRRNKKHSYNPPIPFSRIVESALMAYMKQIEANSNKLMNE